jgi:endonuclease YncB( thermonuclease family)
MPFPLSPDGGIVWRGTVDRVIDGDTLWITLDRGFDDCSRRSIRLRGVDTSELRDRDPAERERAALARDFLENLCPPGTPVEVHTYRKSFERYVGDVWVWHRGATVKEQGDGGTYTVNIPPVRDPRSLAEHMIAAGFQKAATIPGTD